jgi:hypothetical protein
MAKTRYNKNNKNNKKTRRKKTRRFRGGAPPTPKVGANSMFGFNLDFLGNYLPKMPEFMKFELPKFELPKLEMPTMNTFNPFATSKKNKCDICETEECKKHLEEKSNQGTQPTEEADKPTEDADKPTEETDKPTEEADKPTEETNQVGGKNLKYKKKRTRRRKYNKKKQ